jgi:hypothetical protein
VLSASIEQVGERNSNEVPPRTHKLQPSKLLLRCLYYLRNYCLHPSDNDAFSTDVRARAWPLYKSTEKHRFFGVQQLYYSSLARGLDISYLQFRDGLFIVVEENPGGRGEGSFSLCGSRDVKRRWSRCLSNQRRPSTDRSRQRHLSHLQPHDRNWYLCYTE